MDGNNGINSVQVFRDAIIGHLAKGFVHNLNSPLQIISMHLELMRSELSKIPGLASDAKGLTQTTESILARIDQIEDSLSKMDFFLRVVNQRKAAEVVGAVPVIIPDLIKREIEFWQSDLFLKHQVQIDYDFPDPPHVVTIKESVVRDLVDGSIGLCLSRLQESDLKNIKIRLACNNSTLELAFEHSGEPFPSSDAADWPVEDKLFFLPFLKVALEDCKADLKFDGNQLKITLPVTKQS